MRTYSETVDFIFSKLPMFTRIGPAAYKADLNNIKALVKSLNNPHQQFKTIHIAGTNGKGSTSHFLAATLQTAGYKTALFTSPHLLDFRERIRINGETIPEETVVEFIDQIEPFIDTLQPSFFEITVALAFHWFCEQSVDIAVIETGLGGRLDSTNIITPILSVITNISLDHTNLLGNSLEQIAREKAGIIKPGIPVVIGQTQSEISNIFTEIAAEKRALCKFVDQHFEAQFIEKSGSTAQYRIIKNKKLLVDTLSIDLPGSYQRFNVVTALGALDQLQRMGWQIEQEHIRAAFSSVKQKTGLRGRWEQISVSPVAIADVGHNEAGMLENKSVLEQEPTTWHYVIGVVNDKDLKKMVHQLPKNAVFYASKPNIPRGLDTDALAFALTEAGKVVSSYLTVEAAYRAALKNALEKNESVFVGGSTFVVAEVLPICPLF